MLHHYTIFSFACIKMICRESSLMEYSLIDTNMRITHGNCYPLLWKKGLYYSKCSLNASKMAFRCATSRGLLQEF